MTNISRSLPSTLLRMFGAYALLASAGIHLDLYVTGYRSIPTIGVLFLIQAVAAIVLGLVLVIRREPAPAGMGALLAFGTLVGYLLSRAVGLFGFHEVATRAGLTAGLLETLAFLTLGYFAAASEREALGGSNPTNPVRTLLSSRLVVIGLPLIGVLALSLTFASGLSGATTSTTGAHTTGNDQRDVMIVISNFAYVPAYLTVYPGEKIYVHNKDTVTHTLTATPGSRPFGNFNTGNIAPNQTKSFDAPMKPGTYQYLCSIHNFMTGVIKVKG